MSFTDGKPRVATAEDLKAPWSGRRDGSRFRCRLCGHKFAVGDVWRFVFANFSASPSHYGNFFVCEKCDGPDVLARAAAQEEEGRRRFWWLRDDS